MIKRMLGIAAFFGCLGMGWAQKEPCALPGENDAFLGIQTIRLWPGQAPQAKGTACESSEPWSRGRDIFCA